MLSHTTMVVFIAVIEHQGISASARVLKISPAAVSKHIKALEEMLKLKLLIISRKGINLTNEGQIFYDHAKVIISRVKDLELIMGSLVAEPQGILRIFSSIAFAEYFLIPFLPHFAKKFPKVEITLDIEDRIPRVEASNFDIALGLAHHWQQDLIQKKLLCPRYMLVASPSYLECNPPIAKLRDLANHTFIAHARRPVQTMELCKKQKRFTMTLAPKIKATSVAALIQLAEQGMGLVNLYDFMVSSSLANGSLKQVLPDYEQVLQAIYAFYTQANRQQPKLRVFVEELASFIEEQSNVTDGWQLKSDYT